jgi:chain length determinant protein tyrosine kinase EpsG
MMAKMGSSQVIDLSNATRSPSGGGQDSTLGRLIGEILVERLRLTSEQVAEIVAYAKERGIRFGDAAVALGYASADDVLQALAEQFQYPYAPPELRKVSSELVVLNEPFSAQAEAFRAVRSQLMMRLFNDERNRRALAVVSPDAGDGKTFFSANLAVSLAQVGGRTLIVDADLRGPRQNLVFNVDNNAGLSSLLVGRADTQLIQEVKNVPGLYILPVGVSPPNPLELIERPAFGILMRELAARFDHVIVDTPAAVYGADAKVVADRCGAALLVARKDESRVAALQGLVGAISESQARLVGVIMNEF